MAHSRNRPPPAPDHGDNKNFCDDHLRKALNAVYDKGFEAGVRAMKIIDGLDEAVELIRSYRPAKGLKCSDGRLKIPTYLRPDQLAKINRFAECEGLKFGEALRAIIDDGLSDKTPPCDCKSHNLGVGTVEERIVDPQLYFPEINEPNGICLDDCIADEVITLWKVGIWTLGSCCGHNGKFTRTIIVNRSDHEKAILLVSDETVIQSWQLKASY